MNLEEKLYGMVDWEGEGFDKYERRKQKASEFILNYNQNNINKQYTLDLSLGRICIFKKERKSFVDLDGNIKEIYVQDRIAEFNFDDAEKAAALSDRYNNLAAFE